jgi:hypothetical protein
VADDRESNPGTEPFVPDFRDFGDTGEHSVPFVPDFDDTGSQPSLSLAELERADKPSEPNEKVSPPPAVGASESTTADAPAAEVPAAPVAVPGRYQYVKWWKLLLVIFGAWFAAAEVGLSLFYWWYHAVDKTAALYVVLVYIVACTVAGLMLSMVEGRPLITALSLGVMSGPFASVAAAAPLYGYYSCERMGHCLLSVIPY